MRRYSRRSDGSSQGRRHRERLHAKTTGTFFVRWRRTEGAGRVLRVLRHQSNGDAKRLRRPCTGPAVQQTVFERPGLSSGVNEIFSYFVPIGVGRLRSELLMQYREACALLKADRGASEQRERSPFRIEGLVHRAGVLRRAGRPSPPASGPRSGTGGEERREPVRGGRRRCRALGCGGFVTGVGVPVPGPHPGDRHLAQKEVRGRDGSSPIRRRNVPRNGRKTRGQTRSTPASAS